MKKIYITLFALFGMQLSGTAFSHEDHHHEHGAHVHGVGTLEVVLDNNTLTLHLETPLINVIGFEYTPSTEKDILTVKKASLALHDAEQMFIPTAAAECTKTTVALSSSKIPASLLNGDVSKAPQNTAIDTKDAHGDLDGDFVFTCKFPQKLKQINVNLFKTFTGFEKINVQGILGNKQFARTLTPASSVIEF